MSLDRHNEIRANLIAEMVCSGIDLPKIAKALGLTRRKLQLIMAQPEYEQIEHNVAAHSKKRMQELTDAKLEERLALRGKVEDAVGEAIQVLLTKMRDDKDLRAALEILDRDPRHDFTKASRMAEKKETPPISAEALSSAVKEAHVTHKLIETASQKLQ